MRAVTKWPALVAGLALFVLGLSGCAGLSPETAEALARGWAANANDARNPGLSAKEQNKGAVNARLLRRIADETGVGLPDADAAEASK